MVGLLRDILAAVEYPFDASAVFRCADDGGIAHTHLVIRIVKEVVHVLDIIEAHPPVAAFYSFFRFTKEIFFIVAWLQSEGLAIGVGALHAVFSTAHAVGIHLRPLHLTGREQVGVQLHLDAARIEEIKAC